ncbi:MAG TPA: hypothetical protein VFR81_28965 [Longimicrobium sp.]|nr:hypothetical protein [Longimicrobium sp.]
MDAAGDEREMAEREERAGHALNGYRERRRRRRAEDTYFGSASCLLTSAEEGVDAAEISRRRIDVLTEAEAAGMSPELAEMLYDVAREEGLDPLLAYELVRSGLGVSPPPDGVANAPSQPTTDKYVPEWLYPPAPTDAVLRERMLRMSFRRVRALLEEHPEPEQALRAFAREPDVGHFGY